MEFMGQNSVRFCLTVWGMACRIHSFFSKKMKCVSGRLVSASVYESQGPRFKSSQRWTSAHDYMVLNCILLSFQHLLERHFCLAFYFKWKYFVLIDHILSETIRLFCFCVLFSNIFTKIKVTAKSWSDLCNFYSKVIFWNFCLRKYFLLFFAEFELLMFFNNIVKISEKLNKWNLLKIRLQITYPIDFCMICLHFYYGKKWKYLIF